MFRERESSRGASAPRKTVRAKDGARPQGLLGPLWLLVAVLI